MILDDYLKLADAQESTASVASTNVVDTLAKGDVNASSQSGAYLFVRIDTAVTAAGAATVEFQLQTSASEDFTGGADTLVSTAAVGKADLVAGKTFKLPVPVGALRYIRGYAVVSTGPLTAGKWDMFIAKDVDIDRSLA